MRRIISGVLTAWLGLALIAAQELPRPSLSNATIISIEHNPLDAAAAALIKARFAGGLYAWISLSVTTLTPEMDWHAPLDGADAAIKSFKTQVDRLVQAAKKADVRLHLVLTSGLARGLGAYALAKTEDIRNAQWYNDNRLAADDQMAPPEAMRTYIFGTLSRYARKMRSHLRAKSMAALGYLSKVIKENPDTLIAVSGWGEAELNYHRINHEKSAQDWFCDYSPFAVLEFRDWLLHQGEYDDAKGAFKGQGWTNGGAAYRGPNGLARFNAEFGTGFKTWDLRYYNWSLADDYDASPADDPNPDPGRIPLAEYRPGGMMEEKGGRYLAGGFDPPRVMEPGKKFWDLWNTFRETMVANFVREAAAWANAAGIPPDRWYSHQIPGDYLFNTNPSTPQKNARYYTSAATLRSADIRPFGNPGATIYDVRFPTWFARTTLHAVPALAAMSSDWAIMEFDPELYPPGMDVPQSSPEDILEQYLNVYRQGAKLINFWRWWDNNKEHRIKGMNKEPALAEFIRRVRDKARSKDPGLMFTPPRVNGVSATADGALRIAWSSLIWPDAAWKWTDWGDFEAVEVFRSTRPGFVPQAVNLIGASKESFFLDRSAEPGSVYFYKVRALNTRKQPGPLSEEVTNRSR